MTGWLYFVAVQLVSLLLSVIGWAILLPLALAGAWISQPSRIYERPVLAWRGGWLTYLWGNDEDGVTGALWYRTMHGESRWRAYLWSAWRNPVGNLRWFVRRTSGPFYRWISPNRRWYFQAGFRPDNGWPVLSAGRYDFEFDY